MPDSFLSIAIVTHNRFDILQEVLSYLVPQIRATGAGLIVINNASTDTTSTFLSKLSNNLPNLKYEEESNLGISYARNRALKACKSKYIVYLDDDAKPSENYVEEWLKFLKNHSFCCISAPLKPWIRSPLPSWFINDYESTAGVPPGSVVLPPDRYAYGGNMAFDVDVLRSFGGFNLKLGVVGRKILFGEETEVQHKMRKSGYDIGYCSGALAYHYAKPEKYTIKNMIFIQYKAGISEQMIVQERSTRNLCVLLLKLFVIPLKKFVLGLSSLIKGKYFWQNLLIDVVGSFAFFYGSITTLFRSNDN